MGFSILLALLNIKFKKVAKTNKNFRKFLMGHECAVVIKTKDGKRGKRFIFKDGGFSSDNVLDEFDAAMVWRDARTGFNGLRRGEDGINDAMKNHLVGIEGKIHSFAWFGGVLKFVSQ